MYYINNNFSVDILNKGPLADILVGLLNNLDLKTKVKDKLRQWIKYLLSHISTYIK